MSDENKCPDCDGPNSPDARSCRWCGTDLRAVMPVAPPAPVVPREEPAVKLPPPRTRLPPASRAEAFDARMQTASQAAVVVEPLPPIREGLYPITTHIMGLDEALGGGIPEGYVLLLEGGPGTMRSSLAFWILAHSAVNDARRGIYFAFEESAGSLFGQMTSLGVPLPATSERLIIADPAQLARLVRSGKQDWLAAMRGIVEPLQKDGLGLLVLDPLASLDAVARFREHPDQLLRLFDWLHDSGLTSIIVADRSEAELAARDGRVLHEADFLADGIVQLRLCPVGEHDVERRLRIVKLRGVRHATDELALRAVQGRLEVAPLKGSLPEAPLPRSVASR